MRPRRLHPDGSPDAGFGGGSGFTITQLSTSWDEASDPLVLPDGRILTSGIRNIYGSRGEPVVDYPIVRYTSDGSLDTSFGNGNGVVSRTWNARPALLEGGRILMHRCSDDAHWLQRLNANGTVDIGFGNSDGTIIVNGSCRVSSIHQLLGGAFEVVDAPWYFAGVRVLARYNADGTLVPGGATAGLSRQAIPWPNVADIAAQPDGNAIVLLSGPASGSGLPMMMARLHPDGSQDFRFGPPRRCPTVRLCHRGSISIRPRRPSPEHHRQPDPTCTSGSPPRMGVDFPSPMSLAGECSRQHREWCAGRARKT